MARFAKVQRLAERLKKEGFKVVGFTAGAHGEADGFIQFSKRIKVIVPEKYKPAVQQINKDGRVRYYEEAKSFEALVSLLDDLNAE